MTPYILTGMNEMKLPPFDVSGTVAFVNEVGSGMWGMASFASDIDLACIFIYPTVKILRGQIPHKSLAQKRFPVDDKVFDLSYFEIGHLIHLLMVGNVNALWAATSPITHVDGMWRERLASLTRNLLSKQYYFSMNGMAMSQLKDARKILDEAITTSRHIDEAHNLYQKKLNTSMRTIRFGIRLLERGVIDYHLTKVSDVEEKQVEEALEHLRYAFMRSGLPETIDVDTFGDFLYAIRMKDLEESKYGKQQ